MMTEKRKVCKDVMGELDSKIAAHIISDSEEFGEPIVSNGLSLCKIHHAAFDCNIIGVSPDFIIEVREDVQHEVDGPMLKHGIQELQSQKIILPHSKGSWPDREKLDIRYRRFRDWITFFKQKSEFRSTLILCYSNVLPKNRNKLER